MSEKIHVYISADYSEDDGDREVVDQLNKWGADDYHLLNFADLAAVASGSVSKTNDDCRPCDLKAEFNRQINKSSVVIIVIGNKTKDRTAGSNCSRNEKAQGDCTCTPYKKMLMERNRVRFHLHGRLQTMLGISILTHIFDTNSSKPRKRQRRLLFFTTH